MKPPGVKTKVYISDKSSNTKYAFIQSLQHAEVGPVLFISKAELSGLPVECTKSIDRSLLKRITFSYPADWNEIISKLFNIHIWKMRPKTIIIDGFDEYVSMADNKQNTHPFLLCSAILDAAGACAAQDSCQLLVTIDKDQYHRHCKLYDSLVKLYFYGEIERK